jgi:hypothetical protein
LVFLELHFETQVGTDVASNFTHVFKSVNEHGIVLFHIVGNDQSGGLNRG